MKALVGAFNQEKALVGTFSVIVKSSRTLVSSSNQEPDYPYHKKHAPMLPGKKSPKELGISRADLWAFAGLVALD